MSARIPLPDSGIVDRLPDGFQRIEAYSNGQHLVIVGTPDEADGVHDCDEMGCGSLSHVVYRGELPLVAGRAAIRSGKDFHARAHEQAELDRKAAQ